MLKQAGQAIGKVQALYLAPFKATLPLSTVTLFFLLALVLAAHWRLILSRIDLEIPE